MCGANACMALLVPFLGRCLSCVLHNGDSTSQVFQLFVSARNLLDVPKPYSCEPTRTDIRHSIASEVCFAQSQLSRAGLIPARIQM